MRSRSLLAAALLLCPAGALAAEPSEPAPRVFAVLAEYDRLAARPLWPGFEPAAIPLEIYDGGKTWLVRHPHPPAEFVEVTGHPEVRVFAGRHETARANTAVSIAGVAAAGASFQNRTEDASHLAALALHEAFHVFQAQRHPKWGGDEGELFVYKVEDGEALALRRMESAALARALAAPELDRAAAAAWAARFLESRKARFARLPASSAAYERGTELKEGLARYIQALAAPLPEPLLTPAEFPAERVRDRAYASGCAMAVLLDRLDSAWKAKLEGEDASLSLDELLGRAVDGALPAAVPEEEARAIRRRAEADAAAWSASRVALRRRFLESPGWTVIVVAGPKTPLFPQGFDPLNVERLTGLDVLHTRWVKVSNGDGSLEALDRACMTEGVGPHPLFQGVRRATVAGIAEEPKVEETAGKVQLTAPGVTLEFRGARVAKSGRVVTITVGRTAGWLHEYTVSVYSAAGMIKSFGNAATEDFFHGRRSAAARKIPPDVRERLRRKLDAMNAAEELRDLDAMPGNRLEKLSGNRAGSYSMRINDQWRVVFRWTSRGPEDVEWTDYH